MTEEPTRIYGDGHVHLYRAYDPGAFLRRGLRAAAALGGPLLLLLTERHTDRYFSALMGHAGTDGASLAAIDAVALDGLVLEPTMESVSLRVAHEAAQGPPLFIIAGRQHVSQEKLEVLTVGIDPGDEMCAGTCGQRSAEELVRRGLDAGAITVLPWGFGKWLGARGRQVRSLCSRAEIVQDPLFFVGDILARCRPWPTPDPFRGAARILPGTDVLPLAGFEERVADYGFRLRGRFDSARPCRSLIELLRNGCPIETFGRRDPLLRTLGYQLRYRLRGQRTAVD